jgi:hypothetical protein
MATLGAYALTLIDWAKRLDPDGTTADVVELLDDTNEILDDMLWVQGNLPTGHRTTVRTGLPSVVWRKLNYGTQPSKSTTRQVDDTCGMLTALSQIDKALLALNGNDAAFRLSEEAPFLEAMNQEFLSQLWYGDTDTNPEKILGFANRYPTLSTSNVINAGGSGSDVTSMWLVCWGANTCHGTFPKGSKAGINQQDYGEELVSDSQSPAGQYPAARTWWEWHSGLVVRDWRYIVRICNIESTGSSNIITPNLMAQAWRKLPTRNVMSGKLVFYCNSTVLTQLDEALMDKSNAAFTIKEIFGQPVTHFWGIPVRQCDSILNTETALV